MFATKQFSVCSEEVGHFTATYALFKFVFNQFGGHFILQMGNDHVYFWLTVLGADLKIAYTYACKRLKKPPDPWRRLSKSFMHLFMNIQEAYIRTLLIETALKAYLYDMYLQRVIQTLQETCCKSNIDKISKAFHPSWLSDESFLKFGTDGIPLCCPATQSSTQVPDISVDNAAQVACFSRHCVEIMLDTGATRAVSPFIEDFLSYRENKDHKQVVKGIAKGLKIKGSGKIHYKLFADDGTEVVLVVKAYHVPDMQMRLVSPQDACGTLEGNPIKFSTFSSYKGRKGYASLDIMPDKDNWETMSPLKTKKMQLDPKTSLPFLFVRMAWTVKETVQALQASIETAAESNSNLTSAQKELITWHQRLGHISFATIQWLARSGKLPCKNPKAVGNCDIPICASCQFAKQKKRPDKASKQTTKSGKEMELKKQDLFPGQRVSADHFQSAVPGRTYSSRGSYHPENMYNGGTIFVDHASGKISIQHQVSLSASESIKAKLRFEQEAAESGVRVSAYHSDNGIYSSNEFMAHLAGKKQPITFSGAGAAHQNAVAEQAIQTVTYMARTLLIHASMRSPEETITANLWPMAMDYAVWVYNNVPKKDTGLSPNDIWSRSQFTPIKETLGRAHVWGAPTYVLEPKLQKSGVKIPKWAPRSRRGAFMGFSPKHSTLVGLILNLRTKSITPQFHVVFDDSFSSVHSNTQVPPKIWEKLITSTKSKYQVALDDDDDSELADEWLTEGEILSRDNARRQAALRESLPPDIIPEETLQVNQEVSDRTPEASSAPESSPSPADTPQVMSDPPVLSEGEETDIQDSFSPEGENPSSSIPEGETSPALRRSSRTRSAPIKFTSDFGPASKWQGDQVQAMTAAMEGSCFMDEDWSEIQAMLVGIDSDQSFLFPKTYQLSDMVLAAIKHDPDTPSLMEALSGENAHQFKKAMTKEIEALKARKTWTIIHKSKLPKGARVIPTTWAMKIKRYPNGDFRSFKARFCVRGDLQKKTVSDIDTYSPVVQWSTVRLMLIISIALNLKTRSTDFSNAFAQAEMKGDPVYIAVPPKMGGFPSGSVLKLNKSLYGQVDAPKMWYDKLRAGLEERGFTACKADPCLFISKKVICVSYVDDCLWFAKDSKDIDAVLKSFESDGDKYNWEMTEGGSVEEFLGIKITPNSDDGFKLTQTGLIDKILLTTGMQDCNPATSPTSGPGPLGSDNHGKDATLQDRWSYASVVGMMMYLASNSRPEISFAVHQCARFTHNTKHSHEKALLHICKYLQGTKDNGLILRPKNILQVDCYADANFAGLYSVEEPQDSISVKSRTGYVLTFAGCPIHWVSKLQTEIALSTLHAEYVALSQSLRDLLPTKDLVSELLAGMGSDPKKLKFISKSTVYEDNNGAIRVATCPKLTPTSKFIAVKYHWFRQHVESGEIQIEKIASNKQLADIFTKGLQGDSFIKIRKLLCGW